MSSRTGNSGHIIVSDDARTNESTASGERRMWQAILDLLLRDATSTACSTEAFRHRRDADGYIRSGRKDFRLVCEMAGFDPDHVRDAYLGGRISGEMLRTSGAERSAGRVRP